MLGLKTVRGHTFLAMPLVPGSLVVDLGAHLGEFSLEMARDLGCICLAVEASPTLAAKIPHDPRVRVVSAAVVGKAGTVTLNLAANPEASHIGPAGDSAIQIRGLTLSQLFEEAGTAQIGLIKFDIEGSEIEALLQVPGHELARVGQLSVEFHDFAGRATLKEIHTVEQRLTRLGFTHIQFSVRDRSNVLFLGPKLVSPWRLAVLTLIARPLMAAGRAVGRILRDNCGRARGPV